MYYIINIPANKVHEESGVCFEQFIKDGNTVPEGAEPFNGNYSEVMAEVIRRNIAAGYDYDADTKSYRPAGMIMIDCEYVSIAEATEALSNDEKAVLTTVAQTLNGREYVTVSDATTYPTPGSPLSALEEKRFVNTYRDELSLTKLGKAALEILAKPNTGTEITDFIDMCEMAPAPQPLTAKQIAEREAFNDAIVAAAEAHDDDGIKTATEARLAWDIANNYI